VRRSVHLAAAEAEFWASPDFSRVSMPPGFPDALRRTAKRFLNEYRSQLRPFEAEYEVAPGVVVRRTGGHTPGHSVVRLTSGGDRLTFVGDAVFQVGFEHPTPSHVLSSSQAQVRTQPARRRFSPLSAGSSVLDAFWIVAIILEQSA
jgi:glyoxylase-like metal-dependent hydrolase (beta-lactamase superfamily II)